MIKPVGRVGLRRMLWTVALLVLVCRTVEAGTVNLAWDPNTEPDVAGYIVYAGPAPGTYTSTVDVGNVTAWSVVGLTDGQLYFFSVTAYNTARVESAFAAEVSTTVVAAALPDLTITSTHVGSFSQGQVGAVYTLTASNVGTAVSSGTVTVTDVLPAGLTATAIAGTGWSCTLATLTCTNSAALAAGASYPPITVTVTVASTAAASVTNTATVRGGGETNLANNTATDVTTVLGTVARVVVTPATATVNAGAPVSLSGQAFDGANNAMPSVALSWQTANAAIASLSATTGAAVTVTGAGVGTTTITLSGGGRTATATLTVNAPPAVSRVTITPASASLQTGQTQPFVALAYDATNAAIPGTAFTWTTTDSTIAPLSTTSGATVTVTPTASGTATLQATATSNGTFAQATVTVTAPPAVTRVTVTPASTTLNLGRYVTLQAQGFDASNTLVPTASFTWTSSAAGIAMLMATAGARVDMLGYSAGAATITVTETASNRTATTTVTVQPGDSVIWDTFTGTNGTALSAHVADANLVGGGWSIAGTPAPVLQAGLARVTTSGAASSRIYATLDATTADVHLATDWAVASATPWGGLVLRWSDASNFLFAGYNTAHELAIYRVQGGVWTRLVGAPITVTAGTTYYLEIAGSGANLDVYWNGALQLQTTDTFNQTVTRHGLVWANGVDTASGYDDFRITGTIAAPPPPPPPSGGEGGPAPSPGPTPSPGPVPSACGAPPLPLPEPPSPVAATGLTATVDGATVVLRWVGPTTAKATSYVIEAGSYSGGIDQANGNIGNYTAYTASPVPPGIYYVRIRAIVNGVPTTASNEITVTVGRPAPRPCGCGGTALPPTGLSFAVRGADVTLNWGDGGGAPSSYVIEAGSFSSGANLANIDTFSTATSFFAPGVGSGTYFVRVRAKTACGVSGASNEVVVRVGQ